MFNFFSNFKTKKRILLISHDLSNTGAPRVLVGLTQILKELGFFVMVLSLKGGELKKTFKENNVPVFVFHKIFIKLLILFLWFFRKFDLIICNTIVARDVVVLLQKKIKKPVYWWIHESGYFDKHILGTRKEKKYTRAIAKAKNLYCVSELSKAYVSKYNSNIKIFRFGIKDEFDRLKCIDLNDTITTFVFVGTICKVKAQDILVDAFLQLKEDYKARCCIKFIGHIENKKYYNFIKSKINKNDKINFLGALDYYQTLKEIKKSTVLVLSSTNDSYPTVIMEALMLDKPVIISDSTGISPLITNGLNGFVFKSNDTKELSILLDKFINNRFIIKPNKPRELFLEKFSLEVYKENVKAILKDAKIDI